MKITVVATCPKCRRPFHLDVATLRAMLADVEKAEARKAARAPGFLRKLVADIMRMARGLG